MTDVTRAEALQTLATADQPISVELLPKPTASKQSDDAVEANDDRLVLTLNTESEVTSQVTIATQTDDDWTSTSADVTTLNNYLEYLNFDLDKATALQTMFPMTSRAE